MANTAPQHSKPAAAPPPDAEPGGREPPPRDLPPPLSDDEKMSFAKQQSKERGELLKKHVEARRHAKSEQEAAELKTNQAAERFELNKKQAEERAKKDPRGQMPTYKGLENQEAVAALHADLTAAAKELNIEVGEIKNFGLEFDVFDPVTGTVTSPARAHRRDVGTPGALMTREAVVSDIGTARTHQIRVGAPPAYAADKVM